MGTQRHAPSTVNRTPRARNAGSGRGLARHLGSSLACAILFMAPATGLACEPAEQALAERRAREISREVARHASVEARKILRKARRELQHLEGEARKLGKKARKLEKKARLEVKKVREKGEETRDLLEKLQPPPQSSAPAHTDTSVLCEGDTCTIDQETATLYAKEPMLLLHEGTILPIPGAGSKGGLRILSLREGGLGERLGLRPGDVLRDIDGAPLTSLFSDPETQRRLASSRSWTLTFTRDGRALQRSIALR